ncbi:MAG TPA: glucosamine-6-phosphate deaminase, partial [Bacillota bacterium]|nr:glucosamine-6-phosphate deaminase [Bacillota bacterium]
MLDCNRYSVEGLEVRIFPDRELMGRDAAAEAASRIKSAIERKGSANVVFAAAPSQLDMLKKLSDEPGLDWSRVNAFHL